LTRNNLLGTSTLVNKNKKIATKPLLHVIKKPLTFVGRYTLAWKRRLVQSQKKHRLVDGPNVNNTPQKNTVL
jgi:hypothetical protein